VCFCGGGRPMCLDSSWVVIINWFLWHRLLAESVDFCRGAGAHDLWQQMMLRAVGSSDLSLDICCQRRLAMHLVYACQQQGAQACAILLRQSVRLRP
jgi:hypothetical protein